MLLASNELAAERAALVSSSAANALRYDEKSLVDLFYEFILFIYFFFLLLSLKHPSARSGKRLIFV